MIVGGLTGNPRSGETNAAEMALREMQETWPTFDANAVSERFLQRYPETRQKVQATLRDLSAHRL